MAYFENLKDRALSAIGEFGAYEDLVSDHDNYNE